MDSSLLLLGRQKRESLQLDRDPTGSGVLPSAASLAQPMTSQQQQQQQLFHVDADIDSPKSVVRPPTQDAGTVRESPRWLRILNCVTYFASACVTALVSGGETFLGPGRSVSGVFDTFETRITPAAYALWVWVPIHALGAAYVTWQMFYAPTVKNALLRRRVDPLLALCNILTAAWMLTFIWGSVGERDSRRATAVAALWVGSGVVVLLEGALLTLVFRSRVWLTTRAYTLHYLIVDVYFSLYCGWVTVLTVVNVATALSASQFERVDPFDSPNGWACALLCLAATANLLVLRRSGDSVFASVFCWTLLSIAFRDEDELVAEDKKPVVFVAISLTAVVGAVAVVELGVLTVRPCWLRSGRQGPTWITRRGSVNEFRSGAPPRIRQPPPLPS